MAPSINAWAPGLPVACGVIGDMYHGGAYHFLSADLAGLLAGLGLRMKANLVWYDVSKSLHLYGYQYEYIPSLIHQSVLIFRHLPTAAVPR